MNINPPTNNFEGGMTPDERGAYSECQWSCHFDNFTKAHSLIPYRSSEDGGIASQSTLHFFNFLIAKYDGKIYAQGITGSGNSYPNVFVATDPSNPSWAGSFSGSNDDASSNPMFVEYEGAIFGGTTGTNIWAYDIAGTTFTRAAETITSGTLSSNGFVKEGKLYFGAANLLIRKTTGGGVSANWSTALTLPANFKIVSLCDYGNLIAIGCQPTVQGSDNSFVFTWDTSAPTWTDKIDFGNQNLQCIENIDGYIIGVSISGNQNSDIKFKLVFRQYSGSGAVQFKEIYISTFANIVGKQKVNNRLYFGLSAATSTFTDKVTNDFTGIWSVGRNGISTPFAVNMIQKPNNDTVATAIKGFFLAKDYFYISYLDGASAWALSKTNDTVLYNVTAIYRTVINPRMGLTRYTVLHPLQKKQLFTVCLTYVPLITGTQIVLKVRVDQGSWKTCFTRTGASQPGEQVFETTQDSTGASLPQGRDFEFQIESQGVEVTGLIYKYDTLKSNIT